MKFSSYKHLSLADSWDAIIIGSGIGGLSTAALLSIYGGQRVLVLAGPAPCGMDVETWTPCLEASND